MVAQHRRLVGQLRCREVLDDPAVLHDVEAVRERSRESEVLLHHDDRVAAVAQRMDRA